MNDVASIKVLCVDDDPDLSLLLQMRINMEAGMESVGRVHDLAHLADEVRRTNPQVVVLDLSMLGRESLDWLREFRLSHPDARALIYSGYVQPEVVSRARDAGAWGFVAKGEDGRALLGAIRRIAAGEHVFPPD